MAKSAMIIVSLLLLSPCAWAVVKVDECENVYDHYQCRIANSLEEISEALKLNPKKFDPTETVPTKPLTESGGK